MNCKSELQWSPNSMLMVAMWHFKTNCEGLLVVRKGRDEDTLSSQQLFQLPIFKIKWCPISQQAHTMWKTVFGYLTDLNSYNGRGQREPTFEYLQSARHSSSTYISSPNHFSKPIALTWSLCNKWEFKLRSALFQSYRSGNIFASPITVVKGQMVKKALPVLFLKTGSCTLWASKISAEPLLCAFEQVLSVYSSHPSQSCSVRP